MDMNRFGRWRIGPFVLILLFLSGIGLATARDATLTNIIVTNTRDDLLVYLTELGLLPHVNLKVKRIAPYNGPIFLLIGDTEQAVGRDVAARIYVSPT